MLPVWERQSWGGGGVISTPEGKTLMLPVWEGGGGIISTRGKDQDVTSLGGGGGGGIH